MEDPKKIPEENPDARKGEVEEQDPEDYGEDLDSKEERPRDQLPF